MSSHETVQRNETAESTPRQEIRFGKIARVVLLAVPVIAIAVLTVFNTQKVTVDWVVGDAQTNLWIVIVVSALTGFIGGYIAHWRRS
jgi:uncharacterized integral membrane protein